MNEGIGYATSEDGLVWAKQHSDNPLFHKNDRVDWRSERTYTPMVIYDSNAFSGDGEAFSYKMWFSGEGADEIAKVGYATAGIAAFVIQHAQFVFETGENNDKLFMKMACFDPDFRTRVIRLFFG